MAPLAPLSADQIESVHEASLRLLEEYGIEVMSAEARDYFRAAGAQVDDSSMIVRADRGLIMAAIATAPATFRLTPTNPRRALTIGGNHIHFGMVSGAPNAHDIRGGRRSGNFDDYKKLIKLGQSFNVLHFFGNQTLAPNDLATNTRHLDTTLANLTLTDKIFMSMSIGAGRVRDAVALTAIARGMTVSEMAEDPSSISNININSPRKFDVEMAAAAAISTSNLRGELILILLIDDGSSAISDTVMPRAIAVSATASRTRPAGRVRDAVALTAIARGMTVSEMAEDPSSISNININSPRKFDVEMAAAAAISTSNLRGELILILLIDDGSSAISDTVMPRAIAVSATASRTRPAPIDIDINILSVRVRLARVVSRWRVLVARSLGARVWLPKKCSTLKLCPSLMSFL